MRPYFAFAWLPVLFFIGLFAPVSAAAQPALTPVVPLQPMGNIFKNHSLSTVEAAAFFAGRTAARKFAPNETVYVVARPFPRKEKRSRATDAIAFRYDAAAKVLTLFGGFHQRATRPASDDEGDTSDVKTLKIDATQTAGKTRDEKNEAGKIVSVTPQISADYTLELTGLSAFDPRLFDRNTSRFTVAFRDVDEKEASRIGRSYQVVVGVRRTDDVRATSLLGAVSIPRNLQEEANLTSTYTMKVPVTDLFVVEAVTKKVIVHYMPRR